MKIPPRYQMSSEILDLIAKIDANRIFFSTVDIPKLVKEKIQRVSLLKSSLFSARIEGNPLTLENIRYSSEIQRRIEIENILKAIRRIDKEYVHQKKITKEIILNLHKLVLDNIGSSPGKFRKEIGAIFNQTGVAVYVSPAPTQIPSLLDRLLDYIIDDKEKFPLITAFIAHLIFEKIHPFMDGNGRVGRLLIFIILKSKGYHFGLTIPFEEYLDIHKDDYYYYLDIGLEHVGSYLLFMLKAFYEQSEKIKESLTNKMSKKETFFLPLRQEEIFNIIKDHAVVSFDFIRRRFLKIPERTLRYDLKKLGDLGLIIKIGKTKGCIYRIKE